MAALDARLLASHVCELSPEETIAKPRFMLSPVMTARINAAAARRLAGEPVSRIIGQREFWGLPFSLSPHTLDPRPETELMVEAVVGYVRQEGLLGSPLRVLDLGTGSGCLLGAILSELPLSYGVGVDLSEGALCIARENSRRLGLLNRASFLCADWAGALSDSSFDIVVCNPPYIGSLEIAGLETEVKAFDPRLALDGGEDGFAAFRAVFAQVFRVLRSKGFLIFETGYRQAQAVREMMVKAALGTGGLEARILVDLSGTERAVAGVRQSVDC
jgi:release factor glutamine methyltransferase